MRKSRRGVTPKGRASPRSSELSVRWERAPQVPAGQCEGTGAWPWPWRRNSHCGARVWEDPSIGDPVALGGEEGRNRPRYHH